MSKQSRQSALIKIIEKEPIGTQWDLVRVLRENGHPCTQASVSRDIRELGLVKHGGRYIVQGAVQLSPETAELAKSIKGFLIHSETVGENLAIVKCLTGTANSVALFIDCAGWPGVVGSIAGDDTLFVGVRNRTAGREVTRNLLSLIEQKNEEMRSSR